MKTSPSRNNGKTSALAMSLEPRFMFDAAGVATGAEVAEQTASAAEATAAATTDGNTAEQQPATKEVYFIDSAVSDADDLAAGLGDGADVVMVQSGEDGLQQVADYLSGKADIDAIHILSHGSDGTVLLGDSTLNSNTLSDYSALLGQIGQSLTESGDILLYGCNIGASDAGSQFVSDLAIATNADVAASDDVTGIHGDWELETTSGVIDVDISIVASAMENYEHDLATFDFTTSSDNGSNVTTTVSTVTLTATSSNGAAVGVTGAGGYGGTSGNILLADTGGATASSLTLTFDKAVDITSIRAVDTLGGSATNWTFTPDSGGAVVQSVDGTTGVTVSLNFSAVNSVTITSAGNVDFGVDTIIFAVASTDPTITSATYDASSGNLTVTGTNFSATAGATNDIDASKLTITGEGGSTYTLTDTSDVEITSATEFTLSLSATDKAAINQIMNKDGTSSTGGTSYDVDGAAGFVVDSGSISDNGANGITVSNVPTPTISSATYDYSTNTLTVTGTGFVKSAGASNDIDISKLTFTGEGGATYTLTSASDVEITDGTTFSLTLSGADITGVESLLNKDGTSADNGTTYNLAAAEDWAAGADAAVAVADLTGNGITVSNYAVPAITSATYNASTNALVLTGTNFVLKSGATNDIDASTLTITGEGGATYTLTDTSDVEITSATSATLTLSSTDAAAVEGLLNKDGTTSATSGTTFNLAAADDWMTGSPAGNAIADATTGITVSNYASPTITSASYDYNANTLTVTGTNFVSQNGANNDVDISKLTVTGEGGSTYTLTGASDIDITSDTQFTLVLTGADITGVESLLNKDGTTSATSGTTFNLAAADDWMIQAPAAADISDATNAVTVSNYASPVVSSATYDWSSGVLTLTGTNFVSASGASNDIDASLLTITGEGGSTYTLTNTSDVDITSATSATVTLSATDILAINGLLNKDGTSSDGSTTYNVAAADNWMTGAPTGNNIADATTGITVSNYTAPTITSAAYDYGTNTLTVTGTNFVSKSGASNDVDISKLTFTGEGGATYTLTSASDVEITNGTTFSLTLTGADITGVENLLNKDGASSDDATTYNIAAADNWMAGAAASSNIADLTGNGITVSNYSVPSITSATYDWTSGQLILTGSNFVSLSGATNDIDASLLTITGEGGASYTLTNTADVEITSATSATLTLSTTDQLYVEGLLNKDGTASSDSTTYNVAAADGWMAGSPSANNVADATTAVTVSNVTAPTVTSATYDSDSGLLTVTGTNFTKASGASNDIDISTITLTGEGGSYTLASASDVEITDGTTFSVTLSGSDKTNVDALLDQIGTSSSGGTTYNIAVADDWMTAADSAANISDAAGNGVTVTINPKVTSATYDASTGTLVVTGTNIQPNGGGSDIDASKFTITGEGGITYTLTDTADVERDSVSQFTLTLSATDKAALNQILNKNGSSSTGGTAFNIAAADDWDTNVTSGDTSDTTGNAITVSNVATPTITSATYDVSTNQLVVTGTGFLQSSGAANDIDVSKLTITGEGGASYTLTSATDVEITSGTSFTVTLSANDAVGVEALTQANGTSAADGTTYNLAAAEDWAAGADSAVNVADLTGNGITVSNFAAPSITSATYDWSTGQLVLTGSNFIAQSGSANDIDASLLTLTGEGGTTYTLTDTADVEITSATSAKLALSATDQLFVEGLLNKDGTASDDSTTYNVAAAEDWMTGSASSLNIADGTSGVTVSNYAVPTITSAAYDASTNTLTVTGTNFVGKSGAANDIDISLLTLTGPGSSYTLTTTADVDVSSATQFSVTLNATDTAAVEAILNTNENTGTVYGLTAADNWLAQAPGSTDVSTNSGVTVSGFTADSDDSTSLNVSQNSGQGQTDPSSAEPEPDSLFDSEGPQTFGDSVLDPLLSSDTGDTGASDTTTSVSVLLTNNQSSSSEILGDPSAGIDALTVVRNAVTGNDNALNQFYGAERTSTPSATTPNDGGLNGLAGQDFNNLTGTGLGLSDLVDSMLGKGGFGGDGGAENDQLSPEDFSQRQEGFSAQLAKSTGIRETILTDTLKGRS